MYITEFNDQICWENVVKNLLLNYINSYIYQYENMLCETPKEK